MLQQRRRLMIFWYIYKSKTTLHQTCQEVKTSSVTIKEEDEDEQVQKQSIQLQETSKRQQKNSSSISDHLKKYFEKLKKVFLHHWVGYKNLLGFLHRCHHLADSNESSQLIFFTFSVFNYFSVFISDFGHGFRGDDMEFWKTERGFSSSWG